MVQSVVALGAEVLEPEARLARVGDHVGAPVLEVLDATDLHARVVDVDPVVGEEVGPVDDQADGQEVAVGERAAPPATDSRRRRRVELRARAR